MTKKKSVAILWILILSLFTVFTVAFWPIHFYQDTHAPENFMVRARAMTDAGDPRGGTKVLEAGIEDFRPPYAEPYVLYGRVRSAITTKKPSSETVAQAYARAASFYRFTQGDGDKDPIAYVNDNPQMQFADHYPLAMKQAYLQSAENLAVATNVPWPDKNPGWTPVQDWLLCGGMVVNAHGRIGSVKGPISNCNILVQSGGGENGSALAHIYVNGQDYALLGEGLQVVLVDQSTGKVTAQQVFNLKTYEQEAHRLTQFLESTPNSAIAIFAVKGDGGDHLTKEAEKALLGFGLRKEALIQYEHKLFGPGYSFAAIGTKNLAEGEAMQAWSPDRFKVYPGHPVTCAVIEPEPARKS